MGEPDYSTMNNMLKELYSSPRIDELVYDGRAPLSSYLGLSESFAIGWPRSKARAHRRRQEIAVARDVLEQCGLYPFKRSSWFPDLRNDEDKAQDLIGRGLAAWLPRSAAGRVELIQKLTDAGLVDTEAARRVIAQRDAAPNFYGIARSRPLGAAHAEPISIDFGASTDPRHHR